MRHACSGPWALVLIALLCAGICGAVASDVVEGLLNRAQAAQFSGDWTNAFACASKAIELDPTNAQCFYVRGRLHAAHREPDKAVIDFSRALQLEPRGAEIYQLRGLEQFKLGNFQHAISDFDTFLKYVPKQEPYHWHRGVAYYFAGRFEDGRKQFEMRQALGTNTIENAFWHFLCVGRAAGLDKARASLFPRPEDSSLPMRKIYDLFAGKATPEEVLAVAQSNYASSAQLNRQLFFAHFYLGFYYELTGNEKLALVHAREAAGATKPENFMGEVAALHAGMLQKKQAP